MVNQNKLFKVQETRTIILVQPDLATVMTMYKSGNLNLTDDNSTLSVSITEIDGRTE